MSFRLSRLRCRLRVGACSSLTCLSFAHRPSLPLVLSLALFRCGLFGILWALSLTSSFCVLSGLFGCTSLIRLLFLCVLVLSLSLLDLLLALFLRMLLSFFIREVIFGWSFSSFSFLVFLFRLLLSRLPLPSPSLHLLVLFLHFVHMGLRRLGLFTAMLLCLPSLSLLLGLLLQSFHPFTFPMFSSPRQVVMVWVSFWWLVPWCEFYRQSVLGSYI